MKNPFSSNLIKVFWKKDIIFWKKTLDMKHKLSWIPFIIFLLILTIWHYAVVSISFLFECCLWIFNRDVFKSNIYNLERGLIKK